MKCSDWLHLYNPRASRVCDAPAYLTIIKTNKDKHSNAPPTVRPKGQVAVANTFSRHQIKHMTLFTLLPHIKAWRSNHVPVDKPHTMQTVNSLKVVAQSYSSRVGLARMLSPDRCPKRVPQLCYYLQHGNKKRPETKRKPST